MTSTCAGCSTVYAVGLPACPNCGSTVLAGTAFPQMRVACRTDGCRAAGKVTVVRLASVAPNIVAMPALACTLCGRQVETVTAWKDNDMPKITRHGGPSNALADPPAPAAAPEPKEEVASSPGNSSQTSSEKPEPSQPTKPAASPKRARTTGSRSGKARTAASTARGTAGDPTEATSESG